MAGGRKLSDVAAKLEYPRDSIGSDFEDVEMVANRMGFEYDPWQRGLLTILFSRGSDGLYSCGEGGLTVSSCRQIGKTFTIGSALFIQCVIHPGLKVIWTAHHTRTSDETFGDMCGWTELKPVRSHVLNVRRANGQQEIRFTNGARIMFGARENGFGRGLHGADVEVFDEAQILTDRALSNMVPVMNTSPDPLAVFLGNPPKPGDPSDVFAAKRRQAMEGRAHGMAYIELSADKDCDSDDRAAWAKANPSFPARTSEESIIRMRQLLPEDSFRREALGIWDEATQSSVIPPAQWADSAVKERRDADGAWKAFSVDMTPDRAVLTIGAAMMWPDGTAHVEVAQRRATDTDGVGWAVDWLAQRWPQTAAVVIDTASPAASLIEDLQSRHVRVTPCRAMDMGKAVGRFRDMLHAGALTHLQGQTDLDDAVAGAALRPIGRSGAYGWDKLGGDMDISPLVAVTLALHGAATTRRRPGRKARMIMLP